MYPNPVNFLLILGFVIAIYLIAVFEDHAEKREKERGNHE